MRWARTLHYFCFFLLTGLTDKGVKVVAISLKKQRRQFPHPLRLGTGLEVAVYLVENSARQGFIAERAHANANFS